MGPPGAMIDPSLNLHHLLIHFDVRIYMDTFQIWNGVRELKDSCRFKANNQAERTTQLTDGAELGF
jgi:hypothetical protein